LAVILIGFADRSAVTAKINGANGLPILVALILSFLASLVVAVIAGLFGGWGMLGKVLLFTVPYHVVVGGLLIWRLQSLATQVAEEDRANSLRIAEMFKKPGKPRSEASAR
jgi:pheromone shutdown protein TraB